MISCPFAYECSNLCSDIFSTDGRNNTIKSSKLFVLESEVMENVYLDMFKSDMKGVNLVPSKNKNKKTIQWILDDDVVDILPSHSSRASCMECGSLCPKRQKISLPNTQTIDLIPTGKRMS